MWKSHEYATVTIFFKSYSSTATSNSICSLKVLNPAKMCNAQTAFTIMKSFVSHFKPFKTKNFMVVESALCYYLFAGLYAHHPIQKLHIHLN
jgi:hypothetical protein